MNSQTLNIELKSSNRSFRYGDGLFETMKMVDGEILFFDQHLARLQKGMQILKMSPFEGGKGDAPSPLGEGWGAGLKNIVLQTSQQNKHSHSCKIRLQVYRDGVGEGYIPNTNDAQYTIETTALANKNYELNQIGIKLGLYAEIKKPQNILSNLKTSNALYSVLAGIYAREQNVDDCLLVNESGNIVEAIGSNIFIVKEKILYTSSLDQGCLEGVMRNNVIALAKKNNIMLIEKPISIEEVKNADEVFLTSVIKGIVSVQSYEACIYDTQKYNMTKFVFEKILF